MRNRYARVVLEERPEYQAIVAQVKKAARETSHRLAKEILSSDAWDIAIDVLGASFNPSTPEAPEDWDPRNRCIGKVGAELLAEAIQSGALPKTSDLFSGTLERALERRMRRDGLQFRDALMSTKVDMLSAWDPGDVWVSPGYRGHSSLIYDLNQFVAYYMEDYGSSNVLVFNFSGTQDVREAIEVAGPRAINRSLEAFESKFLEIYFQHLGPWITNDLDLIDAVTDYRDLRWEADWSEVVRSGPVHDARKEMLAYAREQKEKVKGPKLSGAQYPEDWDPRFKGPVPSEAREVIKAWLSERGLIEDAMIFSKELRYEDGRYGYRGNPITISVSGRLLDLVSGRARWGNFQDDWSELIRSLGYKYYRSTVFPGQIELIELGEPFPLGQGL